MVKGTIRRLFECVICVFLVLASSWLMPKTVNAQDHGQITPGSPVKIDLVSDSTHWFKYSSTKQQVIEVESTGDVNVRVEIYKGSQTGSIIAEDSYSGTDYNFMCRTLIDSGTYWIKVEPASDTSDVSPNNTKVSLSVLSHEKIADFTSAYFPDNLFKQYIYANFDVIEDDILTYDEMMMVDEIDVQGKNITDLTGVELFKDLHNLNCSGCKLNSLKLSDMPKLINLSLAENKATKMDYLSISNCPSLDYLYCDYSNILSLTISGCNSLSHLSCNNNQLESLVLQDMPRLNYLECSYNGLSTLKISGCANLKYLDCYANQLVTLDVSNFTNLYELDCHSNKLTSLKLNKNLNKLKCFSNILTTLDLTGLTKLNTLECYANGLTELDISSSMWLCSIYPDGWNESKQRYEGDVNGYPCVFKFDNEYLTPSKGSQDPGEVVVNLDEEHFPNWYFRSYISNRYDSNHDDKLNRAEVAGCASITLVNLKVNTLKGIEYLTELEGLICVGNELTELDISKNTKLQTLYCNGNKLTTLDISKNPDLAVLNCCNNLISKLDITNNPLLIKAYKEGTKTDGDTEDTVMYCIDPMDNVLSCDKTVQIFIKQPTPTATATPTAKPIVNPTAKPTIKPTTAPSKPTAVPTKASAASLTLDKKTANVVCGKTLTLKATLKGSSSKISWKSSDTKVATVDTSGEIKAKMAGEVTITATAAGKSAKCVVTVLYKDVTNAKDFWYAPTNYLTAKGVVKGYDKQTRFKPANDCTRAQMVTFLYRLQGEPKVKSSTCKFKDVKKTDYFFKPVIWASEKGITTGVSKDKFDPQRVCTRAQTVTFLWRMANKPAPKTTKNKFPDVKKSDYFYTATLWASEKKILAGLPNGTFNPQGKCLRRQMVTFLYKYDKFINKKGDK